MLVSGQQIFADTVQDGASHLDRNLSEAELSTSRLNTLNTNDCIIYYDVYDDWDTEYLAEIHIVNNTTTPIEGYSLSWQFTGNQQIASSWQATFNQSGQLMTVSNSASHWNGTIPANGGSVDFGYRATYSGSNTLPINFSFVPDSGSCTFQVVEGDPSTPLPSPTPTSAASATATSTSSPTSVPTFTSTPGANNCIIYYDVYDDWDTEYLAEIHVVNNTTTPIEGYSLSWQFTGNQQIASSWQATFNQSGQLMTVSNGASHWNGTIPANGGSVDFGYRATYSGSNALPINFSFVPDSGSCTIQVVEGPPSTTPPSPTATTSGTTPTATTSGTTPTPTPQLTSTATSPVPTETATPTVTTTSIPATPTHTPTTPPTPTATTAPIITRTWQIMTPTINVTSNSDYAFSFSPTANHLVLYAGNNSGWPYQQETWRFDGLDWAQNSVTGQPTAVYGMRMAGDILFGGNDAQDNTLADTWSYNGSSWQLQTPTTSPSPRLHHSMAYDDVNGRVYLVGGQNGTGYYDSTWVYESGDWTQISTSNTPPARALHALIYHDNRLWLFGGRAVNGTSLNDLWTLDLTTNEWTEVTVSGAIPSARMAHSFTYDRAKEQFLLFGGKPDAAGIYLADSWLFDPVNLSWQQQAFALTPPATGYHSAPYDLPNHQIVLVTNDAQTWIYR